MKSICLLWILFLMAMHVHGQYDSHHPPRKGVYMSFKELQLNRPSYHFSFSMEKRSPKKIRMGGGNDYKINVEDRSLKRKFLYSKVWAVYDGEDLYLNCFPFTGVSYYTKVSPLQPISLFTALPPNRQEFRYSLGMETDLDVEFSRGKINTTIGAKKRSTFYMVMSTGMIKELSPINLEELLLSFPSLRAEYMEEEAYSERVTMRKYLDRVNEMLSK
ncbi:MAG: DUF6563 family protein [Bacteroidota bacterium]